MKIGSTVRIKDDTRMPISKLGRSPINIGGLEATVTKWINDDQIRVLITKEMVKFFPKRYVDYCWRLDRNPGALSLLVSDVEMI